MDLDREREGNKVPDFLPTKPSKLRSKRIWIVGLGNLRSGLQREIQKSGNPAGIEPQNCRRCPLGSRVVFSLELFNVDLLRRLEYLVRMVHGTQRRLMDNVSSAARAAPAIHRQALQKEQLLVTLGISEAQKTRLPIT